MTAPRLALLALALAAGASLSAQQKDNFGDPLPEGARARVGTTRMHRHGGGIEWQGAALTPDGKFLLAPVTGGAVEKIDVATGRTAGTIGEKVAGRSGREFLYLSADGKVGAGAHDGRITAWDARTGKVLTKIEREGYTAYTPVALSADGSTLAVGDHSRRGDGERQLTVLVWDVGAEKRRLDVEVAEDESVAVALSPDGKRVATWGTSRRRDKVDRLGPPDSPIQFWDATNGKKLGALVVSQAYVTGVAFTPDGKSATVVDGKGAVLVIDPATGKETRKLSVRAEMGRRVFLSPDGKTLAVAWSDGTVKLWDFAADKELSSTKCPARVGGNGVVRIVFTGAGKAAAWGIEGSKAVVWEVPSGKILSPYAGHFTAPGTLAFTADGKELLSNGENWTEWTVQRWDARSGKPLGAVAFEVPAGINLPGYKGVHLFPGGTRVLATANAVQYVYDPRTGKRLHDLGPAGANGISNDGELMLTRIGAEAGKLPDPAAPPAFAVKDLTTGKKLAEIELPGPALQQATRTADGKRLLTVVYRPHPGEGRSEMVLTLWDLATGKKLGEANEPGHPPWYAPAPGPDGKTVLTSSAEGALRLVDLTTGKTVHAIGTDGLTPCAGPILSPDGKLFAVGLCAADFTTGMTFDVRVYDTESGKPLKTFRGHTGLISALAFSPDGKTLASGSADTTVLLWDLTAIDKK